MAGNNGGPWGGGGGDDGGDKDNRPNNGGGRKPGQDGPQLPELEELVKKGQEQLRVLMGGRGGGGRSNGGSGGGEGQGPALNGTTIAIGGLVALGLWAFASFYTVKPEEQSVELFLGKYYSTGEPGLNFAPWPFVTKEILTVSREQIVEIGSGARDGLMLTGDENIVDIDFQVVWNINDPAKYLFNLRDPEATILAVSESAMREVIAQSNLSPILNRDRGLIADTVKALVQDTLNSYDAGINVVRVNFKKADPPQEVIEAFRDVQAASQERDKLEKQADAYANKALAGARGEAAQVLEESEAYRAQVVNQAEGEASRFLSILAEFRKAPEVTRKRLYLETMERVLGRVDKVIIDGDSGGQGVVPYLPLNELRKSGGTE
ncbi:FtsH protease activity modulator HflK [Falsihalocynthiibacter arcticus]|uniref:Protein HflK n=1 Tax=Falsihalocynthiibacter arcticus TaxID=1579316 RepID=A0A126UV45_9RHOB|nr:FtsH protease activity modulator HflK [Falsihalocynthiibacter arcticus]AML49934.1 HflK protein [Falsihalocynthiibacter arcticus]